MALSSTRISTWFSLSGITLVLLLLLTVAVVPVYGQGITTGGVSGTVVDPKGSVVPDAKITVTNVSTGAVYTQTSRSDGAFSVLNLPLGVYKVTITSAGFSVLTVNNVNITVGTLTLGDEILQVGQGVETVEASAAAPLLSTEESQISVTLQSEALENLPFGGASDTRCCDHTRQQLFE